MSRDRRAGQRALRVVEVVAVDEHEDRLMAVDGRDAEVAGRVDGGVDGWVDGRAEERAAAEVATLFELMGREGEALGQLDGGVSLLHQVQAAKAALGRLSAEQLRAGLRHRQALLLRVDTA